MIQLHKKKANMIGHIDYLNLLPFYQFLKKNRIKFIKSYPAKINNLFLKKKIDAAFISSVHYKKNLCFDVGIATKKRVKSVVICKGNKEDNESHTSNILAKILNEKGEVVIGDKAFKKKDCKDLAYLWYKKYNLPFVFATFCANKNKKKYKKIINKFISSPPKIPYLTLKKYASNIGITTKEAKEYLKNNIHYKLTYKDKIALKRFLRKKDELRKMARKKSKLS